MTTPKVTILSGKADQYRYLAWQLGLFMTALSLLAVLLNNGIAVIDQVELLRVCLLTLPVDLAAAVVLGYLISVRYSRSKRFALAVLILTDILVKLFVLRQTGSDEALVNSPLYLLLLVGTATFLVGSAVIGLIIFVRGDDKVPWWR